MNHSLAVRFFGLLMISIYIYVKILNKSLSKPKIAAAIAFSLVMSIPLSFSPFLYELIFLSSVCAFVALTARVKLPLMLSAVFIATGISLGIDTLANTVFSYGILLPIDGLYTSVIASREHISVAEVTAEYASPLYMFFATIVWPYIVLVVSFVFARLFFSMKRLKNGFVFMESTEARLTGMIFCLLIAFCRSYASIIEESISAANGELLRTIFYLVLMNICTLGLYFWWCSHTTMLYQQRLKDRTIEEYRAVIDEKDRRIKRIYESNTFLSETVHTDNKLIPAMYNAVNNLLLCQQSDDGGDMRANGTELLSALGEIMRERKSMIDKIQREHNRLTPTGMERVDIIMHYMAQKAASIDIDFDFAADDGVRDIAQSVITKQQLETLLADLIENAIIATSFSEEKRILVTMSSVEGCLEICVQDSGIAFEPETLCDLGREKATTHADTGGSGIGYLTIFNILRETGASFTLKEYEPKKHAFTKSVSVRFNGKTAFSIYSYRSELIRQSQSRENVSIFGPDDSFNCQA